MNTTEFAEYLRQEEIKDNTIRKILTIEKIESNISGITEKNALKQFKELMLGEYLLGSESEYILEADYFAGKGKNIIWSITTGYSRYEYVKIDLYQLRQSIKEIVKEQLKQNPYYKISENFESVFNEVYNREVEIKNE